MSALPSKTGRPPKSNRHPDEVKSEILTAAVTEFAQHGLGATSTEAIAHRAGVTKAMIHYYFKTKEGLYRAVLEYLFSDLTKQSQEEELLQIPPEQAVQRLIQNVLENAAKSPQIHAILTLEAIQNQGKYYKEIEVGTLAYRTLSLILERGVQTGAFRLLHPQHTAINIMGSCLFYFVGQGNLQHLFPDWSMDDLDTKEKHIQEAIAFIMAGIIQIRN
ncbi:transcriptional regulator, TetR family [Nostoc sp. NIES-3756]|uniref:TetR/AcrR family transcriptional regulator n=1 Tax=Nostoc sp. NIES-3756 TaxID=1751286 RepID=UPI000722AB9F|nr:TetR/AcrR family transcriptional regulator [Nostoc sp. NIES-3756]BAT52496.1 transcriptional regulator, TetR family [Nostoc sp. NIES-3756]